MNERPKHFKPGMTQCKAKANRTGQQCQRWAMKGKEVCMMHGGKAGRPPVHGKYSKKVPRWLQESYEHHKELGDLTDQHEKLALLNALIDHKLEEMGEATSAELWEVACMLFNELKRDSFEGDMGTLIVDKKTVHKLESTLKNGLGVSQKELDIRKIIQEAGQVADIEVRRQKNLTALNVQEANALLTLVIDAVRSTFPNEPRKVIDIADQLRKRLA